MNRMDELKKKFGDIASVQFCSSKDLYPDLPESRPVMIIENSLGKLVVSPNGAHVLSFAPQGGHDIFWLSPQTNMTEGKPIRGGIPLCMPWFGQNPNGFPMHGFARLMDWTVESVVECADGSTQLVLTLTDTEETRAMWPHEFLFRFELIVGQALTLEMTVTNKSKTKADFSFAYHTYFDVSDVSRASVLELDGIKYIDRLDGDALKTQSGPVTVEGETQKVYADVGPLQRIKSPLGIWTVESNTACGLVWNPGDNAGNVADIGAGNETGFLCYERLDALDWSPSLEAGASYVATMTIGSERPGSSTMPMSG